MIPQVLLIDKAAPLQIVTRRLNTFAVVIGIRNKETQELIDLTGSTVRCDVKDRDKVILSFSLADGLGITDDGKVLLMKEFGQMTATPGTYLYDLYVIKDNVKETYLDGQFTIRPNHSA